MELSKNFEHNAAESKWYQHWLDKEYFHSIPDNRSKDDRYTVVMPPPNVTGILHMGHCLNNTIQDILVRRARMQGKNTCWVPGTDHASIATEAKVVQMLREKGITKSSLTRDEFLKYAWEWKEKYGGIILQQLKKLGCSCDWDRTAFTMDDDYSKAVIEVFVKLHKKNLIYRDTRIVHWDPKAKTALSDEEVIYKEVKSKLYFVRYKLESEKEEYITIATVRPETILGDTAIAVNPSDDRYKNLIGRNAFVPLINRKIKIIADEYVAMDFGTGALKVTPAHDKNDYEIGLKHNLDVIDVMNDDATMSSFAQLYVGEDRFVVRNKIVKDLEVKRFLVKAEDYTHQVGFSERTDEVVEAALRIQWWVKMKKLSEAALISVMNDEIKFHPSKFKNLYRHWMENIQDWCISRHLWWGHRIPVWYDEQGRFVVARSEEEAEKDYELKFKIKNPKLKQDEDVLDTWFSSWLWPFEVFHGLSDPGNADIKYYYPTQTLVTAPEIIFFWVARMIMAGFEYMKEKPFSNVYFTGIVRDELGRKMSKQLGNSPDLLGLIDKYGADAVRFGIMISSPAGNDLLFDEASLEQGRNFNNKIWNALKLVRSWELRVGSDESGVVSRETVENFAVVWFENRLNEVKLELEKMFTEFRLSEALKTIYSLIWDDFCSWYLEWAKPEFEKPIDKTIYEKSVYFFEELMQLLHPFMPFITEEIYHQLKLERSDDLCVRQFKVINPPDKEILEVGNNLKNDIVAVRDARKKNELKNSERIEFTVNATASVFYGKFVSAFLLFQKQTNTLYNDQRVRNAFKNKNSLEELVTNEIIITSSEHSFYLYLNKSIDKSAQKEQLQKDLDYQKGFLISVEKKLSNERFVQNAKPEVIELEKKKKADAEAKIKAIEESLAAL